jgi:hypothetical protein
MGNHKSKQHHHSGGSEGGRGESSSSRPQTSRQPEEPPKFAAIRDKYETYEQLQDALRASGLESSNLIIGMYDTIHFPHLSSFIIRILFLPSSIVNI